LDGERANLCGGGRGHCSTFPGLAPVVSG
jgi:hypothetical protein